MCELDTFKTKKTPAKDDFEFYGEGELTESDIQRNYDEEYKEQLYRSEFFKVLGDYTFSEKGSKGKLITSFEKLDDPVRVHAVHFTSALNLCSALKILSKSPKFDVNATDSCNRTPLYSATSNGAFDAIFTLIELGADIHHTDEFGRTFIHMTCYSKLSFTKKLYKYTIDHPECGFKFDFENPVECLVPVMINEGTIPTVKWLIEDLKCDVNTVDEEGNTGLYYVGLFNDDPKKMLYLIEHGAHSTGFSENAFKVVMDEICKLHKKLDQQTVCNVDDVKRLEVLEAFSKSI